MIKWPEKYVGIDAETEEGLIFNHAVDLCIQAEKNGRMSVEEIAEAIYSKLKGMMNENLVKAMCLEIATTVHIKLYGDTKPEKRNGEGKGQ